MKRTHKYAAIFSCVSALKDNVKYNKIDQICKHGIYATIHDCFGGYFRHDTNNSFSEVQFFLSKKKKTEILEQFHADLVELASRADCGDREKEWVRDMFTAHMNNEKIAEELLAQTRTPQEAYEYAIRREKGIEHSRTMKVNPIGGQTVTTPKKEPIHYDNTRGRHNQQYKQNNQRGRGGFRGRPYPRGSQNTRGQQYQQQRNKKFQARFQMWKPIRSESSTTLPGKR